MEKPTTSTAIYHYKEKAEWNTKIKSKQYFSKQRQNVLKNPLSFPNSQTPKEHNTLFKQAWEWLYQLKHYQNPTMECLY